MNNFYKLFNIVDDFSNVGGAELKPISDEDTARYGAQDVIDWMMKYGMNTSKLGRAMTDSEFRKFHGMGEE